MLLEVWSLLCWLGVGSAGKGGQCSAALWEQSGSGPWFSSWEVKLSFLVQMGVRQPVIAWNGSRNAGIYFPGAVGLQMGTESMPA